MTSATRYRTYRGFSLIELVIVVVIIAIIGAIAIPRMSRGASGAGDSALIQNLAVLRTAIDLYATEHGNVYPAVGDLKNHLTMYSDASGGTVAATKDAATGVIYGPYLRQVPPLPVGRNKGGTDFIAAFAEPNAGVPSGGWIYNATTGAVTANTTTDEKDEALKLYSDY